MHMRNLLAAVGTLALVAQLHAAPGWSWLQWPNLGSTHPGNTPITLYSGVWKGGSTNLPGAPLDLSATLYYRPLGDVVYSSVPMTFSTDYPWSDDDEFTGTIPVSALTASQVQFYIVYHDTEDNSDSYLVSGGYSPESPAYYNVTPATLNDFTLHLCVNMSCVDVAAPGVAGSFNGWSFTPLTDTGGGLWCGDVVISGGSSPQLYFKFRNGDDWEWDPNREYLIAQGETEGYYTAYWNNIDCPSVDAVDQPFAFTLSRNYPNPFNPSTIIRFSLPETAVAMLTVHDLMGREVACLAEGIQTRGEHEVVFDAAGLSSGMYLYTLRSNGLVQTQAMLLMK